MSQPRNARKRRAQQQRTRRHEGKRAEKRAAWKPRTTVRRNARSQRALSFAEYMAQHVMPDYSIFAAHQFLQRLARQKRGLVA